MFDLNLQNALRKDRDRLVSGQELKAIVERIFDYKEASKARIKSILDNQNNSYVNSLTLMILIWIRFSTLILSKSCA